MSAKMKAAASPIQESSSQPSELDGVMSETILAVTFHFWWVIVALTLAGGVFGWIFHRLNPPVYEAVGRFSASIDFVLTGPLTQLEEDIALNVVGDLISSKAVIDEVVIQAGEENIMVTRSELSRMATIERRVNSWDLRIRHTDPALAERIANIWIEQGQLVLLDSYQHALQADSLSRYIRRLEDCLAEASGSEPSHAICSRYRLNAIQMDLQEAGNALYKERLASRGLFAGLTIGPIDTAVTPESPVQYGQNQLVFAGGFIGMLLGMGLVQSGVLGRWFKRN